jgi:hypothetical protein
MRKEIADAINRTYIEKRNHREANYRVITEEQVQSLIATIRRHCHLNVTYSADTNYSTCYQLQLMDPGIPTPTEIARKRVNPRKLPNTYYGLFVNISWLAPFAMKYWNKFGRGKDPVGFLEPEDARQRAKQMRVQEILSHFGIQMLSEKELEEIVPQVDIVLLDNAAVNVKHLLFAQYI